MRREGSLDSQMLQQVRILDNDNLGKKDYVIPKDKKVMPVHLLPQLHKKTHFKAAASYALGAETTARSMHDTNGDIEAAIRDGVNRLERDKKKQGKN